LSLAGDGMSVKTVGVVALSSALAGLVGSAVTAQYVRLNYKPELDFYQHKHPYRVDGFKEPKGEFAFTYYYDGYRGAFNRIALKHIEELERRGYVVRVREIHEWLVNFKHPDAEPLNDFAIAYLIAPKEYVRVFPIADGHVGWGVNPDLDHFTELLEFVLDNLDYCKHKAMRNRSLYTRQTWSQVIDQFLKKVEEVWETH